MTFALAHTFALFETVGGGGVVRRVNGLNRVTSFFLPFTVQQQDFVFERRQPEQRIYIYLGTYNTRLDSHVRLTGEICHSWLKMKAAAQVSESWSKFRILTANNATVERSGSAHAPAQQQTDDDANATNEE